jgi:hypothetical protein
MKANYKHIPPLYKEGQTLGIINYYFQYWPNDSGNSLYARVSIEYPALRHHENFQSFTNDFFKVIMSYKKVQHTVVDLDSILNKKSQKPTERSTPNKDKNNPDYKRSKNHNESSSYVKRPPYTAQANNIEEDLYDTYPDEEEFEENNPIDVPEEPRPYKFDPAFDPDSDSDTEEKQDMTKEDLAAVGPPARVKDKSKKPCWFKFFYSTCTRTGCKDDHDLEAMIKLQDARLGEAVNSKYSESDAVLRQKFEKFLRDRNKK